MLFFFGVSSAALIFGVRFCRRLLSYCDGDPSKPHLNLRGKHLLLLFCIICPCFWENCVPEMDLSRAIFSRLGDCFGTPLLWRFLLVSVHNYDWQIFWGWNCGIGIVTDWVLTAVMFQPYTSIENGWNLLHSALSKCSHTVCKVPIGRLVCLENCFAQVISYINPANCS